MLRDGAEEPAMESCYKLPLEDSCDRGPLPWFGGDARERPAADAAAEAFDSLQGALHDAPRWGLSAEAIGTLGERLYEFWQRFHGCFKTSTRDTSARLHLSAGAVDHGRRTELCQHGAPHDRRRRPSLATLHVPCAVGGTRGVPPDAGRDHGDSRLGPRQHADCGRECG